MSRLEFCSIHTYICSSIAGLNSVDEYSLDNDVIAILNSVTFQRIISTGKRNTTNSCNSVCRPTSVEIKFSLAILSMYSSVSINRVYDKVACNTFRCINHYKRIQIRKIVVIVAYAERVIEKTTPGKILTTQSKGYIHAS